MAKATDQPLATTARVRALTPEPAKGPELDLVVLVRPETFGAGIEGRPTGTSR